MRTARLLLPLMALPVFLAGCDDPSYYSRPSSGYYRQDTEVNVANVYYGRIVDVRPVEIGRPNSPGVGAVLGAVIGGVVGSTVGHGNGRTLATVGGAVAGGFAGNGIQNAQARRAAFQLTVQLDDGHQVAIIQDADVPFYPGDPVRVVGYGQNARVLHR